MILYSEIYRHKKAWNPLSVIQVSTPTTSNKFIHAATWRLLTLLLTLLPELSGCGIELQEQSAIRYFPIYIFAFLFGHWYKYFR